MAVRIAKVQARAAARPVDATFDRYTETLEMVLPCGKLAERDGEAEVQVAGAVMRRGDTAWHRCRFVGAAVVEQQQHLAARHAEGAHAAIMHEALEAEHALIEVARPVEVGDVERSFQHAAHTRSHWCLLGSL